MDNKLDISKMNFDYIDKAACYTGNNSTNKGMKAITTHKILSAVMEMKDNINNIVCQLNTYDVSSILVGESNWIKRNHFSKYMPSKGAAKKVALGQVCTVDYGKTYKGEIGYVHPGLCIGKKENKYLIVPMTTGKTWRETCYHPIVNPNESKRYRQALVSESFVKDGVLLINDMKYISGGRILELHEIIDADTLKEIQHQACNVAFPNMYVEFEKTTKENIKLNHKCENAERQINNLKKENAKLIEKYVASSEQIPSEQVTEEILE